MSTLSTHVLDTALGRPAAGMQITLHAADGDSWSVIGEGTTNDDGRVADLAPGGELAPGVYRIDFATGAYHAARGERTFYPAARIEFEIHETGEHYHVPLLVSPWGYSTYRGS